MGSMVLGMHDRLASPNSLSKDEEFGREGWQWRFPADASEATKVGHDTY